MKEKGLNTKKLTTFQFASQFIQIQPSKTCSVFSQPYKTGRLHNNHHLFNKCDKEGSETSSSPGKKSLSSKTQYFSEFAQRLKSHKSQSNRLL